MFRILITGILFDLVLFFGSMPVERIHTFLYPQPESHWMGFDVVFYHLRAVYFGSIFHVIQTRINRLTFTQIWLICLLPAVVVFSYNAARFYYVNHDLVMWLEDPRIAGNNLAVTLTMCRATHANTNTYVTGSIIGFAVFGMALLGCMMYRRKSITLAVPPILLSASLIATFVAGRRLVDLTIMLVLVAQNDIVLPDGATSHTPFYLSYRCGKILEDLHIGLSMSVFISLFWLAKKHTFQSRQLAWREPGSQAIQFATQREVIDLISSGVKLRVARTGNEEWVDGETYFEQGDEAFDKDMDAN